MIADNILRVRESIEKAAAMAGREPEGITLVGACKTKPAADIRTAVEAGLTDLGENRVQELTEKSAQGAYAGARLHFIGHLQKNKARLVVGRADLIQSADSVQLLELIDRLAGQIGLKQRLLLEVNIAGEGAKSGFAPRELEAGFEKASALDNILVCGLMAIPPVSVKSGDNRAYFEQMYKLFIDNMSKKYDNVFMDCLSMGMSGDYQDAILEGSTMIRVGSAIFGART